MYYIKSKDNEVFYKDTLNGDFNIFVADINSARMFRKKKLAEKAFNNIKNKNNYEIVEVKNVRRSNKRTD